MGIFSRTTAAPTTVAEALAGFAQLQTNLNNVIKLNLVRRGEGFKRISDAQQYAATVAENENTAIAKADDEIKRAARAEAMISQLLGEETVVVSAPSQETLRNEQASAHV